MKCAAARNHSPPSERNMHRLMPPCNNRKSIRKSPNNAKVIFCVTEAIFRNLDISVLFLFASFAIHSCRPRFPYDRHRPQESLFLQTPKPQTPRILAGPPYLNPLRKDGQKYKDMRNSRKFQWRKIGGHRTASLRCSRFHLRATALIKKTPSRLDGKVFSQFKEEKEKTKPIFKGILDDLGMSVILVSDMEAYQ